MAIAHCSHWLIAPKQLLLLIVTNLVGWASKPGDCQKIELTHYSNINLIATLLQCRSSTTTGARRGRGGGGLVYTKLTKTEATEMEESGTEDTGTKF
jgi:hypothetical protein